MAIDPVKIPQNVYIEDRIVGPLTLRQILTCAIGVGISYMLYISAQKTMGQVDLVTTVILWIPAAISVLFAFVRVNDLSLFRLLLLTLERFNKPKARVFEPRTGIVIHIRTSSPVDDKPAAPLAPQPRVQDELTSLSQVLDSNERGVSVDGLQANRRNPRTVPVLDDLDDDILPQRRSTRLPPAAPGNTPLVRDLSA
jgi:PrgI family protein